MTCSISKAVALLARAAQLGRASQVVLIFAFNVPPPFSAKPPSMCDPTAADSGFLGWLWIESGGSLKSLNRKPRAGAPESQSLTLIAREGIQVLFSDCSIAMPQIHSRTFWETKNVRVVYPKPMNEARPDFHYANISWHNI